MTIISKGLSAGDRQSIENILLSSGFFYDFEVEIAMGLVDDTLSYGAEECGYHWMKLSDESGLVAFANYTKDSFSVHSWNLYWIAVHQDSRHKKLGSVLLKAVEEDIRSLGGKILWLDTSGRPLYEPTENFYKRNGYLLQASLKDYYAPGDPKQIYSKIL
jgi:GNAT superfamily N-acetyltransferase